MYKTYRKGKYVIIVDEGSVNRDYIDEVCELFKRFGIDSRWERDGSYYMERLVAYCDNETVWGIVEMHLGDIYEKYYGYLNEEV